MGVIDAAKYQQLKTAGLDDQKIQGIAKQKGDTIDPKVQSSMPQAPQMPGKIMYAKGNQAVIIGQDGKPSIKDTQQPNVLQSGYNLILKPFVEGVKAYGGLLGTAAGSIALAGLDGIDPQSKWSLDVKTKLATAMTPLVTQKYDNPIHTITNGIMDTLAGEGAALQAYIGITTGIGGLAVTNAIFNAGMFGTGEFIKSAKQSLSPEETGSNVMKGIFGYSDTGPFVGAFGESNGTKAADLVVSLFAPLLAGHAMKEMNITLPGLSEDVKGRLATSVAAPGETITQSEKIMGEALQMTKSLTKRGMGKELEGFSARLAEPIDNIVQSMDGVTAESPQGTKPIVVDNLMYGGLDEAAQSNSLEAHLKSSKVGQMDDTALASTMDRVNSLVSEGKDSNTSFQKLNTARKTLNSGIPNKWFRDGMPTDSKINRGYFLDWQASNFIKDFISQHDESGTLVRAISMQHIAKSVSPVLADDVLSVGRKSYTIGRMVNKLILSPLRMILEPIQIGAARAAQGAPGEVTQGLVKGQTPDVQAVPVQEDQPLMNKKPTPDEMARQTPPAKAGEGETTSYGKSDPGRTLQVKHDFTVNESALMNQAKKYKTINGFLNSDYVNRLIKDLGGEDKVLKKFGFDNWDDFYAAVKKIK